MLTLADVSFAAPGGRTIEGESLAKLLEFGDLRDVVYSLRGLVSLLDLDDLDGEELWHVRVTLRTLAEAIAPHNVTPADAKRCQVVVKPEALAKLVATAGAESRPASKPRRPGKVVDLAGALERSLQKDGA
jgi:hypothetical protein